MLGRLFKALSRGLLTLGAFLRPGVRLHQLLQAQAALGEAKIINGPGLIGELLVPCRALKLLDGGVVIPVGTFEQAEGEPVTRRWYVLVVAVAAEELTKARPSEGVVLFVVGATRAGQEHIGGLFRLEFCRHRGQPHQATYAHADNSRRDVTG